MLRATVSLAAIPDKEIRKVPLLGKANWDKALRANRMIAPKLRELLQVDVDAEQSGGSVTTRLMMMNNRVTYTLSGTGTLIGSLGGARVRPVNSGVFSQTGGTTLHMGYEVQNGTVMSLRTFRDN